MHEELGIGKRMNRILFEGRFLINMAASIVRQDDLRPVHGKMDWERMFRIADYNKIANLIYIGVLGNEKVPQNWRDCFFDRYQDSLRFGEVCEEGEREILALLDLKEIPTLILESSNRRKLYAMEEMAGECPLRLYFEPEYYMMAKGFLIDLGYETDNVYGICGEHMNRPGGFSVEIYDRLPYRTSRYKKQMKQLFDRARPTGSFHYIYQLDEKERLAYLFAKTSYFYVTEQLLVRQLLDLCLLHRSLREDGIEEIGKWLKKLKIEKLSEKLLGLGYMWFGTKEESAEFTAQDELEVYDVIENRILGYGKEYEETIPEALALSGNILRIEEHENRKARRKVIFQKMKKLWGQLCGCLKDYMSQKDEREEDQTL